MRSKRIVFVALMIVGVLAAIWLGRGVADSGGKTPAILAGVAEHDFGDVLYDGTKLKLKHKFVLKNERERTIRILDIASSCGCTIADISSRVVPPGAEVEVTVALTMDSPTRRRESVWLAIEGAKEPMTLTVSGAARRRHRVYAMQAAIPLSAESDERVLIVATHYESDLTPADPDVGAPNGVSASFEGWQLLYPHDQGMGRPARWHGIISLRRLDADLPLSLKLSISVAPADDESGIVSEIEIDLGGRPWG